jgi:hypothetical protein
VVVDPVGGQRRAGQPSGGGGASVPQRIGRVLHHAVLGDVANARRDLIPGRPRQHPDEQEERPAAHRRAHAEQHRVGNERRAKAGPYRGEVIGPAPGPDPRQRRPAAQIAEQRQREPSAADRPGRREQQVGILGQLRVAVVQVMTAPVLAQIPAQRSRAEPRAHPGVQPRARKKQPVGRLVHEDHEPQLPSSDDHDGRRQGERRRPDHVQGRGGHDGEPRVHDEDRAAQSGCPPE